MIKSGARGVRQVTAAVFAGALCLAAVHGAETRILANGCAPVAVFVACRSLGMACSLQDAIDACGWREGQPVKMRAVHEAFVRLGLGPQAGRLDTAGLQQALLHRGLAVVLLLGEEGPDAHLATAVGALDGSPVIIDYSHKARRWDASALAEHWNGGCIVVTRPDAEVPELPWLAVYSTSRSYALVFAVIAVALGG